MKLFSLRDPAGSSNLTARKQGIIKVNDYAYHSIGNEERSPKMCTDLRLVQNLKSYARKKGSDFQAFWFPRFFVQKKLRFNKRKLPYD